MSKKENLNDDRKIVDALFDLMYDTESETEDDINKRLESYGVDPQQIEARGLALIGQLKRKMLFDAARKKMTVFDSIKTKFAALKTSVERRNVIRELLAPSSGEELVVFNRRLDDVTDEYLETLEDDKMLLQLWNELSSDSEVE